MCRLLRVGLTHFQFLKYSTLHFSSQFSSKAWWMLLRCVGHPELSFEVRNFCSGKVRLPFKYPMLKWPVRGV